MANSKNKVNFGWNDTIRELSKQSSVKPKTPKKIIKVSKHHKKDNEDWFKNINFDDPIEVAHGFGEWLNLYFEVWASNRSTWIDSNKQAFTTKELLTEFINEFNNH